MPRRSRGEAPRSRPEPAAPRSPGLLHAVAVPVEARLVRALRLVGLEVGRPVVLVGLAGLGGRQRAETTNGLAL